MLPTFLDFLVVFTSVLTIVYISRWRIRRHSPYPPGPPGKFLLGNMFDMPTENRPRVFHRWGEQYGGLVHLSVPGQHIAIITSHAIAVKLLSERSSIYSDRVMQVVCDEYVGFKKTLADAPYKSKSFREHRKFFSQRIGTVQKVEDCASVQEHEADKFVERTLANPEQLQDNIHLAISSLLLSIAYGHTPKDAQDKFVVSSELIMNLFSRLSPPGTFIVDTIPILQYFPSWFPGAQWKKQLPEWKKMMSDFVELPLKLLETRLGRGEIVECMLAEHLLQNDLTKEERDIIAHAAGSMYVGGSDTISSAISWFFRYMLLYPQVLERAQQEIDTVLEPGRSPELADRTSLPYLGAVIKEVQRLSEIVPNAIPHRLEQDDLFEGYFLPAGTAVIPCVWSMLRDPSVYANPLEFNPDRFLGPTPEPDPTALFGFGRRVCPGVILAQSSMFLVVAKSITAFHIERAVDSKGMPLKIPDTVEGGAVVNCPTAYPFKITPRVPKSAL